MVDILIQNNATEIKVDDTGDFLSIDIQNKKSKNCFEAVGIRMKKDVAKRLYEELGKYLEREPKIDGKVIIFE